MQILDEGIEDIDDLNRVRRLPSPQLVGSSEHKILDLNTLRSNGIEDRIAGFGSLLEEH